MPGAVFGRRRASGVLAVLLAATSACGGRTEPPEEQEGTGNPIGPDPRRGSCDNPIAIPFANTEVRGRILGGSRADGWCGDGENDQGAEDTYLIAPPVDTDILVFFLPETEFTPTLRVTRDGCYSDEDNLPRVCAAPIGDHAYWHFLAQAGHEYSLTIDSPEGTDGLYAAQIFFSQPGVDACPVHSSQIDQEPGGFFTWSNSLGGRQGRVDGFCGGPGAENMFQINVVYPGLFTFQVSADGSFAPVLSLRSGCGATTELVCTSMEITGTSNLEQTWFFEPGTYFVVVDQNDVEGGEYQLDVFME